MVILGKGLARHKHDTTMILRHHSLVVQGGRNRVHIEGDKDGPGPMGLIEDKLVIAVDELAARVPMNTFDPRRRHFLPDQQRHARPDMLVEPQLQDAVISWFSRFGRRRLSTRSS